ncbi:MAG: ribosome maturation factor RimM [Sideroxydans sp.]|nr:ribosome maturation factor RimM [Sideroxydans sp.]
MVIMGRVAGAHGIQGWVKVQPYTDELDGLVDYSTWWLGNEQQGWRELDVLKSAVQGKSVVAQVMGCHDRNTAEKYKGLLIAVPRNRLPQPSEDEYYWSDLIGLDVVSLGGEPLGKVENLLDTGANQVLCVRGAEKEILIPFIAQVIEQVDLDGKIIRADWAADY